MTKAPTSIVINITANIIWYLVFPKHSARAFSVLHTNL